MRGKIQSSVDLRGRGWRSLNQLCDVDPLIGLANGFIQILATLKVNCQFGFPFGFCNGDNESDRKAKAEIKET